MGDTRDFDVSFVSLQVMRLAWVGEGNDDGITYSMISRAVKRTS